MNNLCTLLLVLFLTLSMSACIDDKGNETDPVDPDNTAPSIQLLGASTVTVVYNGAYDEPGATGMDAEDGDISSQIQIDSSAINIRQPGSYSATYNLVDSGGLPAPVVTRTVIVQAAAPLDMADASRFLSRSTFGPSASSINNLLDKGYANWLQDQFNEPATYQYPKLMEALTEYGYENTVGGVNGYRRRMLRIDTWWDTVVNGNDQLRQRVASALSQIFVISDADGNVRQNVRGVANYNDTLIKQAFGNFRDLLQEVTLSPMMGSYLSMRRNEKASADGTIQPDENYAREIMQLFTIGLKELNLDGTEKLDTNSQPIPTYDQEDVMNFARIFTGWNYGDAPRMRWNGPRTVDTEMLPMKAFQSFHDTDEKTLLRGVVLGAGQTAEQDLNMALDNLFNHSNVGPFIGKQLIQRLVTSNPSNAYVARVASVFNDNGQSVRGDMQAVIQAILMDQEALLGHIDAPETFGKLKEPLISIAQLWRAYNGQGINGRLRYSNTLSEIGQQHLSGPSVFNFYSPGYSHPGEITDRGMVSPEFQILNEPTSVAMNNRLRLLAFQYSATGEFSSYNTIILNLDHEKMLADDPAALTQRYNEMLLGGRMSDGMKSTLTDFITDTPLNDDGELRAKEALFLVITSPEYAYQR